eukprot:10548754-Alexandrium_andersonii.AAC.1
MSASLVGSEMCIRDSPRSVCLVAHRSTRSRPILQWSPIPPYNINQAVSYTHLTLPTICSV